MKACKTNLDRDFQQNTMIGRLSCFHTTTTILEKKELHYDKQISGSVSVQN